MSNIKTIVVAMLLLLSGIQIFGQQTAFFETTLYFEDAVGNRDTIVVGHDPEANSSYNPQFGEVDINTPWDSVFEVRASHINDAFYDDSPIPQEDVFSKKIIGTALGGVDQNFNCQPLKAPIILHISQKYLPIKISWDSTDFDNACSINSTITPHQNPLVTFNWWTDPSALAGSACMSDTSSINIQTFNGQWINIFAMDQKEGIGIDTIYGVLMLFINQADNDSPCDKEIVSLNWLPESINFSLFPNPTAGLLNLESEATLTWQLFDTTGKLCKTGNRETIDLVNYPDGVYFISAASPNGGLPIVKKVLKMKR